MDALWHEQEMHGSLCTKLGSVLYYIKASTFDDNRRLG